MCREKARQLTSAGLVGLLLLTGCATQSGSTARPGVTTTAYGAPPPSPEENGAARTALAVVGTPFFVVFKAVTCALTVVLAAPAVGIVAITDPDGHGWQRQALTDGFANNCGPPYLLR